MKKERIRTIEELRSADKVTVKELCVLTGERYTTLRWYSDIGLLPYKQNEARLRKYYDPKIAQERLTEIKKLKKEKSITEIIEYFKGKNLNRYL